MGKEFQSEIMPHNTVTLPKRRLLRSRSCSSGFMRRNTNQTPDVDNATSMMQKLCMESPNVHSEEQYTSDSDEDASVSQLINSIPFNNTTNITISQSQIPPSSWDNGMVTPNVAIEKSVAKWRKLHGEIKTTTIPFEHTFQHITPNSLCLSPTVEQSQQT